MLHARMDAAMIHLTHDQVEAMILADQIMILTYSRIEQAGEPIDLHRSPAMPSIANQYPVPPRPSSDWKHRSKLGGPSGRKTKQA